jgi:hypothetical protein
LGPLARVIVRTPPSFVRTRPFSARLLDFFIMTTPLRRFRRALSHSTRSLVHLIRSVPDIDESLVH